MIYEMPFQTRRFLFFFLFVIIICWIFSLSIHRWPLVWKIKYLVRFTFGFMDFFPISFLVFFATIKYISTATAFQWCHHTTICTFYRRHYALVDWLLLSKRKMFDDQLANCGVLGNWADSLVFFLKCLEFQFYICILNWNEATK